MSDSKPKLLGEQDVKASAAVLTCRRWFSGVRRSIGPWPYALQWHLADRVPRHGNVTAVSAMCPSLDWHSWRCFW